MNEEEKYKIEQYDKYFKEMEDTIEKQQKEIRILLNLFNDLRNIARFGIIYDDNGHYRPIKNSSRQDIYKNFYLIRQILHAQQSYLNNQEALEELLGE